VHSKVRQQEIVAWKIRQNKMKRFFSYEPTRPTKDSDEVQYCSTSGNIINNPHDRWFRPS